MMLATKNNFIEGCGVFFFAIKKITEEKKVHRDNFLFLIFCYVKLTTEKIS